MLEIVVYNVNYYLMERWCNWKGWCTPLEKLDTFLFCKLFSWFMSRYPFGGV